MKSAMKRLSPSLPVCRSTRYCSIYLALAALIASAPRTVHAQDEDAVLQGVLAAEDAYVAAELSRDEEALRRLIDDRFVFNRADGTTTDKEDLIQNVLQLPMIGQKITERSVLIEDDIALVFGTTEIRFGRADREESVSTLRYTATYVNRSEQWRLLSLQMQKRLPQE
jgi:hypothetical protein